MGTVKVTVTAIRVGPHCLIFNGAGSRGSPSAVDGCHWLGLGHGLVVLLDCGMEGILIALDSPILASQILCLFVGRNLDLEKAEEIP